MTLSAIHKQHECVLGYFHSNELFGHHLGRHLVSKNLSNDEMTHITYFYNLLTIKEQFRNNTSVIWVHFM